METEELPHPPDLSQSFPGQAEDYSSQEKTGGEEADIDSTSCTNSRGSSLSDRQDLDEFDTEGVEDELTQLKTVAALRVMQDEEGERERSLGFDLNSVCEEGKTLLWDLIQDDNAVSNLMFCTVGSSWFHHLSGYILQVYTVTSVPCMNEIFGGPLSGDADIIRGIFVVTLNMQMTILDSTTDVRYYQKTLASVSYR